MTGRYVVREGTERGNGRYLQLGEWETLQRFAERFTSVRVAKILAKRANGRVVRLKGACPCSTDMEEPGPHIASCPWVDPDYEPKPRGSR